jgi:PAS domain S-box-containing protein
MPQTSSSGDNFTHDFLPKETVTMLPSMESIQALLKTIPGVVWEAWGEPAAATQRISYVSDYVEQMTGYSVQDWLNTPTFWLKVVHPDDQERAAKETAAIFASGGAGSTTFRWIAKSGRILWVNTHSTVICDQNGKPAGMRGVTLDITSQKEAEIALRENKERVTLLFRRLRDSILQTQDRIGNNLQFIASLIDEQILEYHDAVPITELRQVRLRLTMLAEVQSTVTEAFRKHDDMDSIPAHTILEVLPDMFTSEARARPLRIETEEVFLSAARVNSLAIIASELIGNAYRYGEGTINVNMHTEGDNVIFRVRDDGAGFPADFKPHDSVNTGLNLVRSIAWSGLSGRAAFANLPEGGACVTLTFPIHE